MSLITLTFIQVKDSVFYLQIIITTEYFINVILKCEFTCEKLELILKRVVEIKQSVFSFLL
jgi:hypothetical protein